MMLAKASEKKPELQGDGHAVAERTRYDCGIVALSAPGAGADELARLVAEEARRCEAAFAFIDTLPADAHLVIHCLRGIGRSTALTLGILGRYMEPEQAAAALHALRPEAKPNRHVVGLCDTVLGLKGKLAKQALRFPAKVWKPAKG